MTDTMDKPAKSMTDDELMTEEYRESCRDDTYGSRLKELREELIRRTKALTVSLAATKIWRCVWCQEIKDDRIWGKICSAPDGNGHLFKCEETTARHQSEESERTQGSSSWVTSQT